MERDNDYKAFVEFMNKWHYKDFTFHREDMLKIYNLFNEIFSNNNYFNTKEQD